MRWNSRKSFKLLAGPALGLFVGVVVLGWSQRGPVYDGQPLEDWLILLASEDYRDRGRAELALRDIGPEAVPELRRALLARDSWLASRVRPVWDWAIPPERPRIPASRMRELAAERLWRLGPSAAPAARDLVDRLEDPHPSVVANSKFALKAVGPSSVPYLITGLQSVDPGRRQASAELLAETQFFGDTLTNAVPHLMRALRDRASSVRATAARALGSIGLGAEDVLAALTRTLTDSSAQVRQEVASGLAAMGPQAVHSSAALRQALADESPSVRLCAADALWKVTGRTRESLPVLLELLKGNEAAWRAAHILGEMGSDAAVAIPALLDRLSTDVAHRPDRTPGSYALALSRMGPEAVPGLCQALHHRDRAIRIQAVRALGGHGPDAAPAISELLILLRGSDGGECMTAAETLGAIGSEAVRALPELEQIAENSDGYLRATALAAFNRIQAAASEGPGLHAKAMD